MWVISVHHWWEKCSTIRTGSTQMCDVNLHWRMMHDVLGSVRHLRSLFIYTCLLNYILSLNAVDTDFHCPHLTVFHLYGGWNIPHSYPRHFLILYCAGGHVLLSWFCIVITLPRLGGPFSGTTHTHGKCNYFTGKRFRWKRCLNSIYIIGAQRVQCRLQKKKGQVWRRGRLERR